MQSPRFTVTHAPLSYPTWGFRAVTSIRLRDTVDAMASSSAVMPTTQRWVNVLQQSDSSSTAARKEK